MYQNGLSRCNQIVAQAGNILYMKHKLFFLTTLIEQLIGMIQILGVL